MSLLPKSASPCRSPHGDMIPLGNSGTGRLPTSFSDPISSSICLLELLSCDIYDQNASLTHAFWFFLQRIFNSFVYTEKISNGESEVQQVSPEPLPTSTGTVSSGNSFSLDLWPLCSLRSQPVEQDINGDGLRELMMLLRILHCHEKLFHLFNLGLSLGNKRALIK